MPEPRFPRVSRRTVLKLLGGAATVAAGGTGGLLALRGCAPRVEGLRCLGDHEYRTMRSLAEALFPAGGAFEIGAEGMDLARAFDGFLADQPDDDQRDVKNALALLEMGPVVFERRLVTFSNLGAPDRAAHFQRWAESADLLRRQVALGLRRFLALVFYDHPEVWPHIGYGGAPS